MSKSNLKKGTVGQILDLAVPVMKELLQGRMLYKEAIVEVHPTKEGTEVRIKFHHEKRHEPDFSNKNLPVPTTQSINSVHNLSIPID